MKIYGVTFTGKEIRRNVVWETLRNDVSEGEKETENHNELFGRFRF